MNDKQTIKAIRAFLQFADEVMPQMGGLADIDLKNLNEGLIAAEKTIKELERKQ